jgi:uroporphyrinogen decarboxylase
MYTHPEVVHAVTRRLVEFYLEGNRRFFETAGDLVDGFFFGNDFGTQRGLFISPDCFEEFVFPYFRQLTELAKAHGRQVILHSCGSIFKVIPGLIDLGVDALHPLQARAADMDAVSLSRHFAGRIAFLGGIDTQHLLIHASPREVKEDVRRVKDLLGPRLIVSPSHEAVLPNIPPANLEAMAEEARST